MIGGGAVAARLDDAAPLMAAEGVTGIEDIPHLRAQERWSQMAGVTAVAWFVGQPPRRGRRCVAGVRRR